MGEVGAGEGTKLTYKDGRFLLGGCVPKIYFTPNKIVVGCKEITAEAFEELYHRWQQFSGKREVVQG
jgi:hypothetical protein